MKKILTILVVLTLVVGAAFAASDDKLKLETIVAKVVPNLQIKDGGESASSNAVASSGKTGAAAGTNGAIADAQKISTTRDISEQDIIWKFEIWQNGGKDASNATVTGYAKYYDTITVSLELEAFTDGTNTESGTPTVTAVTPNVPATADKVVASVKETTKLLLTYSGKVNDRLLGTFTCKWPKDDTLPDSTYEAIVKMTYSAT